MKSTLQNQVSFDIQEDAADNAVTVEYVEIFVLPWVSRAGQDGAAEGERGGILRPDATPST